VERLWDVRLDPRPHKLGQLIHVKVTVVRKLVGVGLTERELDARVGLVSRQGVRLPTEGVKPLNNVLNVLNVTYSRLHDIAYTYFILAFNDISMKLMNPALHKNIKQTFYHSD
jgi:hypothetical protein